MPAHHKPTLDEFKDAFDPSKYTDSRGYNLLIGYVAVAAPIDGTALRHII